MPKKITDNSQFGFSGAAERYLMSNKAFKRYVDRLYDLKEVKLISSESICKKYKLKAIVFGNYVTQAERYIFLFKINKQLELLAKIKGSKNLGKNTLTIGFGADGKAGSLAHFNPSRQFINLNRGSKEDYKEVLQGENSFVHEWGHFIDFNQGRSDRSINVNFASETIRDGEYMLGLGRIKTGSNKVTNTIRLFTEIASLNKDYMNDLSKYSNENYLKKPVEMFARLFEATITDMVHTKYKSYGPYFEDRYSKSQYLNKKIIKSSSAYSLAKRIIKAS